MTQKGVPVLGQVFHYLSLLQRCRLQPPQVLSDIMVEEVHLMQKIVVLFRGLCVTTDNPAPEAGWVLNLQRPEKRGTGSNCTDLCFRLTSSTSRRIDAVIVQKEPQSSIECIKEHVFHNVDISVSQILLLIGLM